MTLTFNKYVYSCCLLQVTDFGLTVNRYGVAYSYVEGEALPIRWTAPEAIKKGKFGEKTDVWAFGITAYEVFTNGEIPYFRLSDKEVVERVCIDGERPLLQPKKCPDAMWTVLQQCWAPLAKTRPTFQVMKTLNCKAIFSFSFSIILIWLSLRKNHVTF